MYPVLYETRRGSHHFIPLRQASWSRTPGSRRYHLRHLMPSYGLRNRVGVCVIGSRSDPYGQIGLRSVVQTQFGRSLSSSLISCCPHGS